MNNRILKKLSKRVKELIEQNPNIQGKFWRLNDPWFCGDDPIFDEYVSSRHSEPNRVTGLWVLGGEADYFGGEGTEIHPLFFVAQDIVHWEFGTPTWGGDLKDDNGNVIDRLPDWPVYHKRLTGAEVIRLIKRMAEALAMSDYTKLPPRDIAECMRRAGSPLSEDQKLLLAGYLAPVQQKLAECEARVAELEKDRLKLPPHDVVINGGITFRKGVAIKTFIAAAERWYKQAMSQHDHVDKEGLRLLFRGGAERAGGEK